MAIIGFENCGRWLDQFVQHIPELVVIGIHPAVPWLEWTAVFGRIYSMIYNESRIQHSH
jgi:hypothetical protein